MQQGLTAKNVLICRDGVQHSFVKYCSKPYSPPNSPYLAVYIDGSYNNNTSAPKIAFACVFVKRSHMQPICCPEAHEQDVFLKCVSADCTHIYSDAGTCDNIDAECEALAQCLFFLHAGLGSGTECDVSGQSILPIFYDCCFPSDALNGRVGFSG
eukprot:6285649-Karenia_brevis.AAC.1